MDETTMVSIALSVVSKVGNTEFSQKVNFESSIRQDEHPSNVRQELFKQVVDFINHGVVEQQEVIEDV